MMTAPRLGFADIKDILDWLVKGKEEYLRSIHGEKFGWGTKEELLQATARPDAVAFRLIEPELLGNGRGIETTLVRALTTGVSGYPRMPYEGNIDGAYATDEHIAAIAEWIDAGTPD